MDEAGPVIAYQFNPLSNVGVFSDDASLLLRTAAWGKRYVAVSLPQRYGAGLEGISPGP